MTSKASPALDIIFKMNLVLFFHLIITITHGQTNGSIKVIKFYGVRSSSFCIHY